MGFFGYVGEALDNMSKVEQNYLEIVKFAKSTERGVNSMKTVVSQKKTASAYTIPNDMKKQCKIIQEKYEINVDSMTEEIRKDRKEIAESRRQIVTECQSIEQKVKRMEESFGEAGGKKL